MFKTVVSLHIDARFTPMHQINASASSEPCRPPTDDGCLGGGEVSLRIDRGGMGGGGKVPHKKNVGDVDEYQNQEIYFSSVRDDIFYYCLMGHYIDGFFGPIGRASGDDIIIADELCHSEIRVAHEFMHEMGHLIISKDASHLKDGDYFWWFWPDYPTDGHCSDFDCSLAPGDRNPQVNYCTKCWQAIDLSGGP